MTLPAYRPAPPRHRIDPGRPRAQRVLLWSGVVLVLVLCGLLTALAVGVSTGADGGPGGPGPGPAASRPRRLRAALGGPLRGGAGLAAGVHLRLGCHGGDRHLARGEPARRRGDRGQRRRPRGERRPRRSGRGGDRQGHGGRRGAAPAAPRVRRRGRRHRLRRSRGAGLRLRREHPLPGRGVRRRWTARRGDPLRAPRGDVTVRPSSLHDGLRGRRRTRRALADVADGSSTRSSGSRSPSGCTPCGTSVPWRRPASASSAST